MSRSRGSYPAYLPLYDESGKEVYFVATMEASGGQLATAIAREDEEERREMLSRLWWLFRERGGSANDRLRDRLS